jgi:hypothetical protein
MPRTVEIDSSKLTWMPTNWPGVSRKLLRNDPATGARASLRIWMISNSRAALRIPVSCLTSHN